MKVTKTMQLCIEQQHTLEWDSLRPFEFHLTVSGENNALTTLTLNRGKMIDLREVLTRSLRETDAALAKLRAPKPAKKPRQKKKPRTAQAQPRKEK